MHEPAPGWYRRLNQVRHHIAHALMGFDGLLRDMSGRVPGHEAMAVRSALAGALTALDRWLTHYFPEAKTETR